MRKPAIATQRLSCIACPAAELATLACRYALEAIFLTCAHLRGRYNSVMFLGMHFLLYSSDPEADRAFFRDVLEFPAVDVGHGWLIFALPPAEIAVHPADAPPAATPHAGQNLAAATVYLMCRNLAETLERLKAKGVTHSETHEAGWGVVTSIALPSGGRLGLYEPHHPLAIAPAAG